MRTLSPDKPRIVKVWDNSQGNELLPLGMIQEESSNTFATWIRALFDRYRLQWIGGGVESDNDPSLNLDQMGQGQALSLVKCLTDWLDKGIQDLENKICSWSTSTDQGEKGDTLPNTVSLSEEQLVSVR